MRVFVSYRRDDVPDATDRLTEDLRERFGTDNVFIDIDSIEIGADFADVIADWVARADAFLAVIGKNWIDARRPDGHRRIDDAGDYVRIEIETALRQNQRVVPVLIHGATAPDPAELPASVAPLMRRNAVELSRKYWEEDIRSLVSALERIPQRGDIATPTRPGSTDPDPAGGPILRDIPSAGSGAMPDREHPRETVPTATATAREVTRDDDIKVTVPVAPVVPPTPTDRPRESAAPDTPSQRPPGLTGQRPRRSMVKLGALAAGLAAVVVVVLVATSGGGGGTGSGGGGGAATGTGTGTGHKPPTRTAMSVVDDFFSAYNRGDNGTAAALWAPAVNKTAVYRPGYPPHAPLQHLTTIAAVKSTILSHGCQRSSYTATVSGETVTATYWSFGQRPGQVKCTAGNQQWKDVFTVAGGHIVSDISSRVS